MRDAAVLSAIVPKREECPRHKQGWSAFHRFQTPRSHRRRRSRTARSSGAVGSDPAANRSRGGAAEPVRLRSPDRGAAAAALTRHRTLWVGSAAMLLLGGCEGVQSVLHPHGPAAERLAMISWVLSGGATAIFVAVMALATFALIRQPRRDFFSSSRLIVAGGLIFPTVTLTALLIYTLPAAGILTEPDADAAEVEVTGYQWWWEVRYRDGNGDVAFVTANEVRLPTGQPLTTRVDTADVIHSFWVPNLAGKIDMIPGRTNELTLQAARPGEFRGQCAEYCGGPHAKMAFYVVAEEPAQYARWFENQKEPARQPEDPLLQRGREVFFSFGCGGCHAIRGTDAVGGLGPDLTHVGSRRTIGAGILDNTIQNLKTWIADSQRIKPDNPMPSFDFIEGEDRHALAAYLKSLQ
jgi:cytochrome c oxidase subunit II